MIEDLIRSPALFPVERLGDAVHVKRMREAEYTEASFLDQRLFRPDAKIETIQWSSLKISAADIDKNADFIFHLGHVGSTLLSRILGAHEAVFSLREPAMLRPIARAGRDHPEAASDLDIALRMFSRTWRPQQRALIKATSFVSELAEDILHQVARARGIILATTPLNYMRVILGGPQSRLEIEALASFRLARLQARLGAPVVATSEGQRIAMTWLCEAFCLHQAMALGAGRLIWIDFDRLLADPVFELGRAFDHLGVSASRLWIEALVQGDVMRRYAKGPEHPYDSNLRRQIMMQAEREYGAALRAGMDWLQAMAGRHPLVLETLRHAAAAARSIGAGASTR